MPRSDGSELKFRSLEVIESTEIRIGTVVEISSNLKPIRRAYAQYKLFFEWLMFDTRFEKF